MVSATSSGGWQGGNVFYGCILGGLTGSLLFWYRHPFPFWPMCDVAAPAVAIGAAVGRLGCFLNGCCDGVVCSWPWGVRFPAGSHAWTAPGKRRVDLARCALIPAGASYSGLRGPGRLLCAGLSASLFPEVPAAGPGHCTANDPLTVLTRWPIESLRGDEPALIAGMTSAQWISVFLLAGGMALWLRLQRSGNGPDRAWALAERHVAQQKSVSSPTA